MPDIVGTEGPDTLNGTSGDDRIYGGGGDDTIDGGEGVDELYGDGGDDTIEDHAGGGLIVGGPGNDYIMAQNGLYQLFGDYQSELSDPVDGNDRIFLVGGSSGSAIFAGGGNDVINVTGAGGVDVNAGAGADVVDVSGFTSGAINLGDGDDLLRLASGNIWRVDLGTGNDTVQFTETPGGTVRITGFTAGDAGDSLSLAIFGTLDNPFDDGTLTIAASGSNTVIFHGDSGMRIELVGVDPANLSRHNLGWDSPLYDPQGLTILDIPDDVGRTLQGGNANDYIFGDRGNDRLEGGPGDDLLEGGAGQDQLIGGEGNDTAVYVGNFGGVFVNLTLGRGFTNYAFGDTYDSIENVVGSSYDDFLIGDGNANRLDGAAGNDTIIGAVGADVLIGGDGIDLLSFEDNSGVVFVNLLTGQGFNNAAQGDTFEGFENVVGGLFDDTLIGDDGANRLDGAMGADTLVGNGGADTFVFAHVPSAPKAFDSPNASANVDTIFDFVSGEDMLEISASAFGGGLTAGSLAGDQFLVGSVAGDANDRFVYEQATGQLFFDADGNGAGAQVLVAVLPNHDMIAASDFVIV